MTGVPFWEIHPALVHFPIAFIIGAALLDVWILARKQPQLNALSSALYVGGAATGWFAASFGLLAFFTVPAHTEDAHAGMYWHLVYALLGLTVITLVAWQRWLTWTAMPKWGTHVAGFIGAGVILFAGYLGGDIVYHGGAGIDPKILAPEVAESHVHLGGAGGHEHHHHHEPETP